MQAKRIVVAIALVATLSGGMAMAADNRSTANAGPTASSGDKTEITQDDAAGLKIARYRGIWDQLRNVPPQEGNRASVTCSDRPMARLLAGLFGFDEIMRSCEKID